MRRNINTNTFIANPDGRKAYGVMARRHTLLWINAMLLIAFVSTSVIALSFVVSIQTLETRISTLELGQLHSSVTYKVNPALPGWK